MRFILMALIFFAAVPAYAQTINYQGVIEYADGAEVGNSLWEFEFYLFNTATGGSAIWIETQILQVTDGHFEAQLGSVVPLDLPFDETYWLTFSFDGDPLMEPRLSFSTAPYAFRAAVADSFAGEFPGGFELPYHGTVSTYHNALEIEQDGSGKGGLFRANDPTSTQPALAGFSYGEGAGIMGRSYGTGPSGDFAIMNQTSTAHSLEVGSRGSAASLYVGNSSGGPAALIEGDVTVIGLTHLDNLRLGESATSGDVLTADADGVATWQTVDVALALPFQGTTSTSETAFKVTQNGTGGAGYFNVDVLSNSSYALRVRNVGSGPALFVENVSYGLAADFDGAIDVDGALTVSGQAQLGSTLVVDSDASIGGSLESTGLLTANAGLDVTGPADVSGTVTIGSDLDVAGKISTSQLRLGATAEAGKVLTADASGNGTWQDPVSSLSLPYSGELYDIVDAFSITNTHPGGSAMVVEGRLDVDGEMEVTGDGYPYVAKFYTSDHYDNAVCIDAECTGNGNNGIAVRGKSMKEYEGTGGHFEGGYRGIYATASGTGSNMYVGVHAEVTDNPGTNRAILARAAGGAGDHFGVYSSITPYGPAFSAAIFGWVEGTEMPNDYAGYFAGKVHVNGILSKSGGSFKIDHPLDPENRYLSHSFVESPDMMNVYNGNAVLDDAGEVWIDLPDWFDVLNRDFRYQLTCIGGYAPIYIAQEVSANRFQIAGGQAGLKVSWQITGIRQDPFAETHRIIVEEDKQTSDRGKYMHPELYGAGPERQLFGYGN